jgi:hypothetical protein
MPFLLVKLKAKGLVIASKFESFEQVREEQ